MPTDLGQPADYLANADWLSDGELVLLSDDEVVRYDLGAMSGENVSGTDAFAATEIDASADGTMVIYGVNGQTDLTLVEF